MFKNYIKYLKDNPKGYWFKRKLYGWGWTPATWQGWLVILAYLVLIIAFARTAGKTVGKGSFSGFWLSLVILTAALIFIAYLKGEKPHWQWGSKKKK